MATIEHSEIVRASPERVFDLLRRVEDFADYSDLIRNQGRYQLRAVPEGTEVSLTLSYDIRNRLMEKAVNKAAKPLVGKVSRQILERVEARLNA